MADIEGKIQMSDHLVDDLATTKADVVHNLLFEPNNSLPKNHSHRNFQRNSSEFNSSIRFSVEYESINLTSQIMIHREFNSNKTFIENNDFLRNKFDEAALTSQFAVEEIQVLQKDKSQIGQQPTRDNNMTMVEDLLKVIYFCSLLHDGDGDAMRVEKAKRNRKYCLEAVDVFKEDLDIICKLTDLIISSIDESTVSHKQALDCCVVRANLWLERSDSRVTLNIGKIVGNNGENLRTYYVNSYRIYVERGKEFMSSEVKVQFPKIIVTELMSSDTSLKAWVKIKDHIYEKQNLKTSAFKDQSVQETALELVGLG
ncbi:hypothetical protein RND71_043052 [Anisodus tanguticus]|uniref:Uncharacterized protein n=1 Tax=Anisodus tanguticus TaxID=243964 RepID=A0AAE1QS32_9SOLA|nr:hypothetical protein RND71_043052 [Anisodus tanguticus]